MSTELFDVEDSRRMPWCAAKRDPGRKYLEKCTVMKKRISACQNSLVRRRFGAADRPGRRKHLQKRAILARELDTALAVMEELEAWRVDGGDDVQ